MKRYWRLATLYHTCRRKTIPATKFNASIIVFNQICIDALFQERHLNQKALHVTVTLTWTQYVSAFLPAACRETGCPTKLVIFRPQFAEIAAVAFVSSDCCEPVERLFTFPFTLTQSLFFPPGIAFFHFAFQWKLFHSCHLFEIAAMLWLALYFATSNIVGRICEIFSVIAEYYV